MFQEVNGLVFLPDNFTEHKSLTQIGVIPFSKICAAFAKLNDTKETGPQLLIVDFLVHMVFCMEVGEWRFHCIANICGRGTFSLSRAPSAYYARSIATQTRRVLSLWAIQLASAGNARNAHK